MGEVVLYPDACEIVCDWLRQEIDDIGAAVHVATRIPTTRTNSSTCVQVRRQGGVTTNKVTDAAQIGVDCWASTEAAAQDLAQLCRGLLHAMEGVVVNGVQCYLVQEVGGPQDFPDPDSTQPRFVASYLVHLRGSVTATAS